MTPATPAPAAPTRPRPFRRFLRLVIAYYVVGLVASFGVALVLAGNLDPRPGRTVTAERVEGLRTWSVAASRRNGAAYLVSVRDLRPPPVVSLGSWSVEQVLGPPNTTSYGDISTAWTTPSQDNTTAHEWLELDYLTPTVPAAVHVHETYNPGAVVRVTVYNPDGNQVEAWAGTDPSLGQTTVSVSKIPLAADFPVSRVRLYLDTAKVSGWNEIDAVALCGKDGTVQWATLSRASASYGTSTGVQPPPSSVTSPSPEQISPAWTGFHQPSPAFVKGQMIHEERVAAAFGWPFLALTGSQAAKPAPPAGQTTVAPAGPGAPGLLSPLGGPMPAPGTTNVGGYFDSTEVFAGESLPAAPPPPGTTAYTLTRSTSTAFLTTPPPGGAPATTAPPPPTVTVAQGVVPRPSGVLWGGLLLNALVFAPVMAVLHWLAVVPQRFVREVARLRNGRCVKCGYDLGFDFIHGCPDCGWRRGDAEQAAAAHHDARFAAARNAREREGLASDDDGGGGSGAAITVAHAVSLRDVPLDDTGPSAVAPAGGRQGGGRWNGR